MLVREAARTLGTELQGTLAENCDEYIRFMQLINVCEAFNPVTAPQRQPKIAGLLFMGLEFRGKELPQLPSQVSWYDIQHFEEKEGLRWGALLVAADRLGADAHGSGQLLLREAEFAPD